MDGIVLLAKKPGLTSFSSLNVIKKTFETKKVGHTGTLDSFAQGLLVVCIGRTTRLAGNITEFDKTYKAIVKFGEETDTLEYTGNLVKTSALPKKDELEKVVGKFIGEQNQIPPNFSAIHIDGKRASDLARKGTVVEIPSRKIFVYNAEIKDCLCNEKNEVLYCEIEFSVSKGTYIRALIRDIAKEAGSSGHLVGLYRTKVGNFNIENAAGFSQLQDFNIQSAIKDVENWKKQQLEKNALCEIENKMKTSKKSNISKSFVPDENELLLRAELKEKIVVVNEAVAKQCGFQILHLQSEENIFKFQNGKPIMKNWFLENVANITTENYIAVFTPISDSNSIFVGLIERIDEKHFNYKFVVN